MHATRRPANEALWGKGYIAYARCASPKGSESKLQEQVRSIRQFGDNLGMRCVDEVRLAGVSGWLPAMRPDLRELLARKRQRDDYDVLVMTDCARLTRAWPDGGLEIEAEFSASGVRIVYPDDVTAADGPAEGQAVGNAAGNGRHSAS